MLEEYRSRPFVTHEFMALCEDRNLSSTVLLTLCQGGRYLVSALGPQVSVSVTSQRPPSYAVCIGGYPFV